MDVGQLLETAGSGTVIIHHSADFDGLVSGAVCKLAFPNATLIGWDYGDPVPKIDKGKDVILVDLSIEELMSHPNLIWIDHHKTAIEKYDSPDIAGLRIDGIAACRLCYQYFIEDNKKPSLASLKSRKVKEPKLVRLLGEHDVWDHRDPEAELANYGASAFFKKGVSDIVKYLKSPSAKLEDEVVSAGASIDAYLTTENAKFAPVNAGVIKLDGKRLLALCGVRGSQAFDKADDGSYDGLLSFRVVGKGVVSFGVYNAKGTPKDANLSKISVKRGGGGHAGASGFELPFDEGFELLKGIKPIKPS